jgi:divalent metal cation (Fe/Co/Zn/Cd) transporter
VLVEKITAIIMSSECITGYHNPFIHDYGHDQQYFSVHVEVPADSDIAKVYSAIENISRKIYEEFGIELAIHVNRIEI